MGIVGIRGVMKQPFYDVWDEFTLYYKFGTIYRKYLLHYEVDVYRAFCGKDLNIFERMFADHWRKKLANVKMCPFRGIIDWKSDTGNKTTSFFFSNFTRFPDGDYKAITRLHSKKNVTFFIAETKCTVRSKDGVNKMSMLEMG